MRQEGKKARRGDGGGCVVVVLQLVVGDEAVSLAGLCVLEGLLRTSLSIRATSLEPGLNGRKRSESWL